MARFSLDGEGHDHGEGSSNPKRQKTSLGSKEAQFRPEHEEAASVEGEDEDEDEDLDEDEGGDEDEDEGGGEDEGGDEVHEFGASVGNGSTSVFLLDPYVFDCSICFEPLSSPVFQCENGHIACSLCCSRIGNKCPSCCLPIGYNRCRAIENVLDSIRLSCQNRRYGCKKTLKVFEKADHEQKCMSAPCTCPLSGCYFLGSPVNLSRHVFRSHRSSVVTFLFSIRFHVTLNMNDRFLILREDIEGELFMLKNFTENLGNAVTVNRFCANSSKRKVSYSLTVQNVDSSLGFYSSTENTTGKIDYGCSKAFLLVPKMFFRHGRDLKLEVIIWDSNPASIYC